MPNEFIGFPYPLPADLPENWENSQIVSPSGESAGLTKQHGYNYLNKQVNEAQAIINALRKSRLDDLYNIYGGPYQENNLEYTGEEQSPVFYGYDPGFLEIEGDLSAVDVGTYTVTFTPKNGYQLPDGTSDPIPVNWIITKAKNEISVDKTELTVRANGTGTVKVTYSGTGVINANSVNTKVASVLVKGIEKEVVVTAISSGTTQIRIWIVGVENYSGSTTISIPVTVEAGIYGASWNGNSATTKWTRTDDAADFPDPVPYVVGAIKYGSPFDSIKPWAQMQKYTDIAVGEVVLIPKFYYSITQQEFGGMKIQISEKPFVGSYVSPAHMDRGDGKGERDIVYIGRYHCGENDWKSIPGVKPKVQITRSEARTAIHNLGEGIWQCDFAMRFTIWLLYIVEFAEWNSQSAIGFGCGDGSNTGLQNMGYTDSMPYHTGTTQSSRDLPGFGTQYRNIEGLWDNAFDWCDGCYFDNNGLNIILNPYLFSDDSGGVSVGVPSNGSTMPNYFAVKNNAEAFLLFIPVLGSDKNSGTCDVWNFRPHEPCLRVGGYYTAGSNFGLFFIIGEPSETANSGISSRPMRL